MTTVREVKALATAALLLVAVAACAEDDSSPRSESPSTTPATTSSPSTATPPSDSAIASASATDVVRKYFAVIDELGHSPDLPLGKLRTVATSAQLTAQRNLIRSQRSNGLHQVGNTKVSRLKVQSVNLDNSDPAAGKVPIVMVDVCWDVSKVDVVNKNGTSVVSSSRPDTGWTRYTVANYHWSKNRAKGWRVATGQDLKKTPCAAS